MAMKRITKRWLFNSFGVILVILTAICVAAAIWIRTYYYDSVMRLMLSKADSITTLLGNYATDSSTDFIVEVRSAVAGFESRNMMELMALDSQGNVIITSSGFESNEKVATSDFESAFLSANSIGEYRGKMNNENVMAITKIVPHPLDEVAAIRLITSLEKVDNQIFLIICAIIFVGISIIFFVILSSSYFINSIVIPIGDVGDIARKIAQGEFTAALVKKNDDEIGDLCDVINYMAGELSNAEKLKNDFISSVSHELRTPLTAIKGWGETLLSTGTTDQHFMQKGMRVIINETERLSTMVEELLDFSRMQSGRLVLSMEKLDILAELSEAVLMFTQRASREGVNFMYEEPDLFLPVMGDKNKLRQVFVNIIDNALKYSDSGGTVSVNVLGETGNVLIKISDTGCGITPEDLPMIKNKFVKGTSSRRGSGIGLAVADEIVTMHGGKINISSIINKGTTVIISLPVYEMSKPAVQHDEI